MRLLCACTSSSTVCNVIREERVSAQKEILSSVDVEKPA